MRARFLRRCELTEVLLQAAPDDYSNLKERQAFYVVSVPGETAWVKEVRLSSLSSALAVC